MPRFFDAHSHLHDTRFDLDRTEVDARMHEGEVWTITVGTDIEESKRAIALAEVTEGVWATVGQHPVDNPQEEFNFEEYRQMLARPKVVAVGECGYDFHWASGEDTGEKRRQQDLFEAQIELAVEFAKPLMVHTRNAHEDTLAILASKKQAYGDRLRGNIHFFSATPEIAKRYFDLNFTISFAGVITFTSDYDAAVRYAPITHLLTETDAPYVAPAPFRGARNEPSYVVEVVARMAELRGEDPKILARATVENACRVFNIPLSA